tara:strand:+ start:541 stop:699 length:159 start_codon:yes stop_codon:yes gene_type:complete
MNLILLLFTIGILLVSIGYAHQKNPECVPGTEIRIVPRNVYDEIVLDSTITT